MEKVVYADVGITDLVSVLDEGKIARQDLLTPSPPPFTQADSRGRNPRTIPWLVSRTSSPGQGEAGDHAKRDEVSVEGRAQCRARRALLGEIEELKQRVAGLSGEALATALAGLPGLVNGLLEAVREWESAVCCGETRWRAQQHELDKVRAGLDGERIDRTGCYFKSDLTEQQRGEWCGCLSNEVHCRWF